MIKIDSACRPWYALYTRSRHEKQVATLLDREGVENYLPLRPVLRQWSDRKKWVEEPLFRCYVFVRGGEADRLRALRAPGAVRIVGFGGRPAAVQEEEIEAVRRMLRESRDVEVCPDLEWGEEVEVTCGPLTGIRGRLAGMSGNHRLVVSVEAIRQTIRVAISRSDVRPVQKAALRA